jgi:hypothetical protein
MDGADRIQFELTPAELQELRRENRARLQAGPMTVLFSAAIFVSVANVAVNLLRDAGHFAGANLALPLMYGFVVMVYAIAIAGLRRGGSFVRHADLTVDADRISGMADGRTVVIPWRDVGQARALGPAIWIDKRGLRALYGWGSILAIPKRIFSDDGADLWRILEAHLVDSRRGVVRSTLSPDVIVNSAS